MLEVRREVEAGQCCAEIFGWGGRVSWCLGGMVAIKGARGGRAWVGRAESLLSLYAMAGSAAQRECFGRWSFPAIAAVRITERGVGQRRLSGGDRCPDMTALRSSRGEGAVGGGARWVGRLGRDGLGGTLNGARRKACLRRGANAQALFQNLYHMITTH